MFLISQRLSFPSANLRNQMHIFSGRRLNSFAVPEVCNQATGLSRSATIRLLTDDCSTMPAVEHRHWALLSGSSLLSPHPSSVTHFARCSISHFEFRLTGTSAWVPLLEVAATTCS